MRRSIIATIVAAGLVLAACGGDDDSESTGDQSSETSEATSGAEGSGDDGGESGGAAEATDEGPPTDAAACARGKTVDDGVLTIATGEPAFPPYVLNDETPEDGQGFEAAVAMTVALELGFDAESVTWVRTAFDAAIAPGPKDFDFNLQQYTITDERAEVVDFSDGYYRAPQAIFGLADAAAAGASTLDDLKGLKIGVAAGTTSVTYVEEVIQPDAELLIFNDNASAKQALESNQIDAIVSDLPTALFITAVEIEGTTVYGQIEGSGTDEFGLLLAKDSPLTECVDIALANLSASGELDQITQEWMSDFTEAPVISL
ncbi:transporter substrate-binding domain-containing protein [Ilumatobacter sp.]|uniref:ABC transporter substrate-binding protein n=1 Tax=Ilumatobacter sp. TaxID=1967498 RepID=UPI003AF80CA0